MAFASWSLALATAASHMMARLLIFSACHNLFARAFISVQSVNGSAHIVLRTSSGSLSRNMALAISSPVASQVNATISSASFTGLSSVNAGSSIACLILSTVDILNAWTRRAFSLPYDSSSGSCSIRSNTPLRVSASNATTTKLNFVFWLVILLALKLASACPNQASGMSGQNVGSLTVSMPTAASSSTLDILLPETIIGANLRNPKNRELEVLTFSVPFLS